jgi:hypothetical protein
MKQLVLICVAVAQTVAVCYGAATGTDLFDAIRAGDAEKAEALLQADPKLAEARTDDGSTALHLAALEGQAEITRLLLANQAQVNARGLRDETPLHMAMYDGHREVAELLLASGADVNAQNTAGETPLHLAARKGYRELVELLVSHNADLDALDKSGRTPKAAAAEKEHWDIVELLTPRVGELYDLHRVVFEGAKTFPPEALRQALKDTFDFFEISHPLAPRDAYLEAIERKLLLGYQHNGFPEARIEARHDAKAARIVVTVAEGPRYVCGEIKVTGTTNVPAAAIVERLIPSPVTTQSVRQAFVFQDKAPATSPLTEGSSDESEPPEAPWVKGEAAPFSNVDLRQMREAVTAVLREHGFLFSKANVLVVPDKSARTAELQVEVLEEGPRGVVDHIEITGNKKNSTEAVLRYLDLKPGMELPSQLVARMEDRLWRAARFLSYKVSLGSPATSGRVPLQIQVAEYDEAPPLEQAFSRTEQTMLKLREWLSKLDESREDMIVNLSGFSASAPEGEFVLSPCNGLALRASDATRQTAARDEYAVVLKGGLAGFYSSVGGRKLLVPCPRQQLNVFLKVISKTAETNESPFNLTTGAGFTQLKEKGPASSSYRFELALPPVACIGLAHRWDCSSWFDGDVLIRSNATLLVKLNTRTGRILELRMAGDKGKGTVQIRFEPGAFDRAERRIEAGTASLPDACDTNAPLSSAVAFLVEEMMSSKYLEPFLRSRMSAETVAHLPGLLRQLKLEEVLEPLNQLLGKPAGLAGVEVDFSIPVDLELGGAARSDLIGLVVGWLLRRSDELFPARSWPWTVLREASLTAQRKGRYTDQALTGIYESSETGPLGYLTVACVLSKLQSPLARKFAARGLERLSAADFRRDCRLFLAGDSISSQCCQRLAATLRELDDEQIAALAKLQSPARGEFFRECARLLRAATDQPVLETLAPAMDHYWENELKGQVASLLGGQTLDADTVFKEALALYQTLSSDKAQAARLFQQAAVHGHAGAQYYLGMIYEQGAGVPKDVAAALNWYRQSATNGYVEAGMTLGNFYSDGLEVKPDYVEAFVWYGVAAAQGNRMAGALRNGMQRKLDAGQLAEAGKRVAAILAQQPPNANVTQPVSSGKDN